MDNTTEYWNFTNSTQPQVGEIGPDPNKEPTLKYAKVRKVKSPERGTPGSAGIDLFVPEDFSRTTISPGEDVLIPSGLHFNVLRGTALVAKNKSGVATKKRLIKGAELIDEDYQGEVHIHVVNVGDNEVTISPGDKIIQLCIVPILYLSVEEETLDNLYPETTERGTGGFGSTGA